ncbi:MAG: tetratricopeptide repeat protein [Stellaceae bacterium]
MPRKPANSLIGAALSALVWSVVLLPIAKAATDPTTLHNQCVAEAEHDAKAALARARKWAKAGGGYDAGHCAAMALYDLKRYAEAAAAFERVAREMANDLPEEAARIYDQAGQAWLVANKPKSAGADFDAALRLMPKEADFLIDRAEALAALGQYWKAIDALNRASDLAPKRAAIYAYRAAAYRAVNELEMAKEDIAHNLKLAPNNPVGLIERGNIRRLDGDLAGARQDWLEVTRIARDTPEAAAAKRNLARLGAIRRGGSAVPRHRNGPP